MSSAGSFQGLQFRIMETLENQPNQAPLTAAEIADILHAGEYRHEMKDNVVFKVTRAVHSMKEQGKIVVTDARDREGRLCYQLPMRTKFPPANGQPPANPVLTPEIAAKVQTVAPKAGPPRGKAPPRYVEGIGNKIVDMLNNAPHPLTTTDFVKGLGHLYGAMEPKQLSGLFSGNLHHLVKNKRVIFRRRVTGYGTGIAYEYYSRKTGTAPHPLAPKKVQRPTPAEIVEVHRPVEQAPLPSQAWAPPREAPRPAGGLFRPQKPELRDIEVKFRAPAAWNNQLHDAARASGISVTEFIIQAVGFAIANLDA
jgi:hypothetical protein